MSTIRHLSPLRYYGASVEIEEEQISYVDQFRFKPAGLGISNRILEVKNDEVALKVLEVLKTPGVIWACDTEVDDIDLSTQGPVGNGKVTCVSIFGGGQIDFGIDGYGAGCALWIENIGDKDGFLHLHFKDWFENNSYKKIWHNYGFDRHVLMNENINARGFAGRSYAENLRFK